MYSMDNVGRNTIAMVLAGGKGERLSPLTLRRAKPSVAFGGKYKIIDFVLSNLFNSGIKKVYILTQYRAYSLKKHIRESWGKWTGLGEFYVAISPETSSESEEWFKGTADAILQYLRFVEILRCRLCGDLRRRPHLQDGYQPDDQFSPHESGGPYHCCP